MRWILWFLIVIGWMWLWPATAPSHAQQAELIRVEGRVERGTPTGPALPTNLLIELRAVNAANATSFQTLTAFASADGSFVFENVPKLSDNNFYILYTTYDGMRQNTQPLFADQMSFVVFLVYAVVSEPIGVEIVNGSIQIDEFAQITDGGTNLVVVMQLEVVNRGDYIIYDLETGTSLALELPVGAFAVDEVTSERTPNSRYLRIEDGTIPIVRDTIPLIPGWPAHTIRVTYLVPYPASAVFDQPFPVKAANLRVWVPAENVYIDSTMITLVEESKSLAPQRPLYDVYQAETLQPNQSLIFTLQGEPLGGPRRFSTTPSTRSDDEGLQQILIMMGIGLLILFGGVVWWVLRARHASLTAVLEEQHHDRD